MLMCIHSTFSYFLWFKFSVVHSQRTTVFCYWSKIKLVSSFPNPFSLFLLPPPLMFLKVQWPFSQLHSLVKYFLLSDLVRKNAIIRTEVISHSNFTECTFSEGSKVLILLFLNSWHGCLHSVFTFENRILGLQNRITVA